MKNHMHNMNKFSASVLIVFSFFAFNCSKTETAVITEYAQVCTATNKDKNVAIQGFLRVPEKVLCMNMVSLKRECGFALMDKVEATGKDIDVLLPEGAGKNEAETPDAGKSIFQSKLSSFFSRNQIKIRLDDETIITPQADIVTPITLTGRVRISESGNICSISGAKIEKR